MKYYKFCSENIDEIYAETLAIRLGYENLDDFAASLAPGEPVLETLLEKFSNFNKEELSKLSFNKLSKQAEEINKSLEDSSTAKFYAASLDTCLRYEPQMMITLYIAGNQMPTVAPTQIPERNVAYQIFNEYVNRGGNIEYIKVWLAKQEIALSNSSDKNDKKTLEKVMYLQGLLENTTTPYKGLFNRAENIASILKSAPQTNVSLGIHNLEREALNFDNKLLQQIAYDKQCLLFELNNNPTNGNIFSSEEIINSTQYKATQIIINLTNRETQQEG